MRSSPPTCERSHQNVSGKFPPRSINGCQYTVNLIHDRCAGDMRQKAALCNVSAKGSNVEPFCEQGRLYKQEADWREAESMGQRTTEREGEEGEEKE